MNFGIYVHIPFCVKKCDYCDFLSFPMDEGGRIKYVEALLVEIKYYGCEFKTASGKKISDDSEKEVQTIYFGGGTPSVLGAKLLADILRQIYESFHVSPQAEITVEINPATIDLAGLRKLQKSGFNRLSIGVQSTDNRELALLGRIHTYEAFLDTYRNAREAGFGNINLDLISALPGQSLEQYEQNLKRIIALAPEHISSYSLIVEEGTPFYQRYHGHEELLPNEDTDREMYHVTKRLLREAGYERYEISNYAKPGYRSRHNSSYWKRIPYLGLGLGASSFMNHTRWKNVEKLTEYLGWRDTLTETSVGKPPLVIEKEYLSEQDERAEFFFLGLRMSEGVSLMDYREQFQEELMDVYGKTIEKLSKQKLLVKEGERIRLTDFGMDVSNYVFEEFI